jgi:hypothetical protein
VAALRVAALRVAALRVAALRVARDEYSLKVIGFSSHAAGATWRPGTR